MEFLNSLKRLSVQIIGGLLLAAICWTASSINNQNVAVAQLVVEVKQLNEKSDNYATKEGLKALEDRVTKLEQAPSAPYKR